MRKYKRRKRSTRPTISLGSSLYSFLIKVIERIATPTVTPEELSLLELPRVLRPEKPNKFFALISIFLLGSFLLFLTYSTLVIFYFGPHQEIIAYGLLAIVVALASWWMISRPGGSITFDKEGVSCSGRSSSKILWRDIKTWSYLPTEVPQRGLAHFFCVEYSNSGPTLELWLPTNVSDSHNVVIFFLLRKHCGPRSDSTLKNAPMVGHLQQAYASSLDLLFDGYHPSKGADRRGGRGNRGQP